MPRTWYAVSTAVGNAMLFHYTTVVDTTGTIYAFYEIEKSKETAVKDKTKTKKTNRTRQREMYIPGI